MKTILKHFDLSRFFLLIATLIVIVMFSVLSKHFLSVSNILDIVRASGIIGLMGIGLTINQASGEFDFSIAGTASFAACLIAKIMVEGIPNFLVAFVITMLAVLCVGMINSFNVLKIGMPSWVATLGLSTFLNGLNKFMTGGGNYYTRNWPSGFRALGQRFLFGVVPMPAVLFLIGAAIGLIIMHKTKTGRYIYAVGSNPIAAEHVGINVKKQKAIGFMLCSIYGGIAGVIAASMLGSVTPIMGDSNLLPAISTSMLGATFLMPGVFNITGTMVGALLLSVISNGLTMINASFFMKDIIQGLVLMISIGMVALLKKKTS